MSGALSEMTVGSTTGVGGKGGGLQKAVIREAEGSGSMTCAFNPTEYKISKAAKWEQSPKQSAEEAPAAQFMGTEPRTLSMSLLFDAWATGSAISSDLDLLLSWTNPTQSSLDRESPRPPLLNFTWGRNQFFKAYLESVTVTYQLFDGDGTPLRANADVTLKEVPDPHGRQNPTSGGPVGNRSAMVTADTSLASIAYREYGRASLWRGLAALNGIDDPFRIPVGTTLIVPPRGDVEAIS
jgi:nucleoid-associated protein YgaU